MNNYGKSTSPDEDRAAGKTTRAGAWTAMLGSAVSGAALGSAGGLVTGVLGGVAGLISGWISNYATLRASDEMLNVSLAREIELKKKAAD